MRLLHFILDGFPTHRADVTALFGRYLPRHGIQSDVVSHATTAGQPLGGAWEGGQVRLCRRPPGRAAAQWATFRHDLAQLRALRPGETDAIQVRDKVFIAIAALRTGRRLGIPVYYWMSFPMSEGYRRVAARDGLRLGLARWAFLFAKGLLGELVLYRWVLPRCHHVFVQSDRMLANVSRRGLPADRMTAVPMGVDLERPRPTRAEAITDPRLAARRVIGYLGSLEAFRRLDVLLDVVADLARTMPDLVLLMIGDSEEPGDRAALRARADALGIADRIVWTGWLDTETAWRWLVNADLAVSIVPRDPLYDGASPTKVVEYLALGIPVVANDQPDQDAVLRESGAGWCGPLDPASLRDAMAGMLADPAGAARMRRAGPAYVAHHRSYAALADLVAATYRRTFPAVR